MAERLAAVGAWSYFVLPLLLAYPSKKTPMKLQREKAASRRAARSFEGDHEEGEVCPCNPETTVDRLVALARSFLGIKMAR